MAFPANKSVMGIDFGTTSCNFGYYINGKVEIFEDEFGNKSMPSYVAFTKDGRLVGEKAKRQMGENPRHTVFAVKKLMGKSYEDAVSLGLQFPFELVKMDHKLCGVEVYHENKKLKLYPEQIAAMLFSKMKYLTEKKLKHPVNAAVISVPPGFNSCQRKATVNAGTIAGFDDVRLVDDSTALATAISYSEIVGGEDENVAVVDFGGGFTSASMITASKFNFKEFPSVTLEFGGIDIDENIRDILKIKSINLNDSITDNENLCLVAENLKIYLSSPEDTTIIYKNERISLTSKEVHHHPNVGPKIVRIIENLKASTSGLSMNSDIDQVILTGEFTKSPLVKNQFIKLFEDKEIKNFGEFPDGVITGTVLESAAQRGLVKRRCSDLILNRTVKMDKDILFDNYKNIMYGNSKNVQNKMILTEYSGPVETPIKTGKIKSTSCLTFFTCSPTLLDFRLDPNKINHASSYYYRLLLFCLPNEYLNELKSLENNFKEKEKKYEDECRNKLAVINKKQKECFDSCSDSFLNDHNEEIQNMVTNSFISENSNLEELEKEINRQSSVQEEIKIKYAVYLENQNKYAESTIERCNILYPDDISKASPEDCLKLLSSLREKKQISTSTGGLTMGIDFGTNKCCVAALVDRNVEVIANEKCQKTTPSYVTFSDNERYFGEDSKHSALMMMDKTVIEPKNKIFHSEISTSFSVKCKSEYYSLNPVQISSMLIKYMKGVANNHFEQEVKDTVICVPTYFNNKHRQSIREAAAIAGLNVLSVLNEPTAAAINYKMNNSEEKTKNINILVFDLGSGGLSVALVGIKEDKLKVYGIDGTTEVSGNVMDEKLVNHFKKEIFEKHGIKIDSEKETEKLRLVCQKIRYELTGLSSTAELFENFDTANDYKCLITRQLFDDMNNDMNEIIIDILDNLFNDSIFPHSQVDEIVMCGGLSRVPLMRKFLSDYFVQRGASCKISRTINEDEAVALGAAYHAACLSGTKSIYSLHVEDLIINPKGNKRGEKLWIAVPQEGGKLIEIRQKKHIITSSGILWNESREQNYDMKILNELERDVDVFNRNDEEQLQLAETRNEFESKCLSEKRKFKKLLRSKTISNKLANKVMSHCDEVLDSLEKDDNNDLSAMRKHQEEFEEFVKEINDEVKKEMERKRAADEEMERKRAAEEMERNRAADEMERKRAANEMERKRAANEMERKRAAEEMERESAAEEMERESAAEEIERESAAEEMERESAAEEMESESAAEEMERKRVAEEMERKRAVEEMERKRASEEMERKRASEEMERKRASEEKKRKRAAEEMERESAAEEMESESAAEEMVRKRASEEKKRKRASQEMEGKRAEEMERKRTAEER